MLSLFKPQTDLFRWSHPFEDVFASLHRNGTARFTPAVDIEELEDRYVLRADLPGVEEKDIEITVHDQHLILSGKREASREEAQDGSTYRERSYGAFTRTFRLGPHISDKDIKASYKNGELILELPKREEAKPRQIKVSSK